jgi:SnoaL-like domain
VSHGSTPPHTTEEWHAHRSGRVDEYAAHLTADYARTTRQGALEQRAAALTSWRARGQSGLLQPRELWVRVYGDAAVLTGVVAGTDSSAPRTGITKTFVRQQGSWLLAALHSSEIGQR